MSDRELPALPEPLWEAVRRRLQPGERIVWCAQPRPAAYLRKALPVVVALALALVCDLWAAGGFAWPPRLRGAMAVTTCLIVGAAQVALAAALPAWWWRKARRTVYLITDRRAILLVKVFRERALSFGPEKLKSIRKYERADGSGEIVLSRDPRLALRYSVSWRGTGFVGIENVREVERLLRELAGTANADAPADAT